MSSHLLDKIPDIGGDGRQNASHLLSEMSHLPRLPPFLSSRHAIDHKYTISRFLLCITATPTFTMMHELMNDEYTFITYRFLSHY